MKSIKKINIAELMAVKGGITELETPSCETAQCVTGAVKCERKACKRKATKSSEIG